MREKNNILNLNWDVQMLIFVSYQDIKKVYS